MQQLQVYYQLCLVDLIATVSRCGMVFMHQKMIGWKTLTQSWVERSTQEIPNAAKLIQVLQPLLDTIVEKTTQFMKGCASSLPLQIPDNHLVTNLLK